MTPLACEPRSATSSGHSKPEIFAATYEPVGDPAVSPVEGDTRHDLPGWDDMSDLDRGAALLHLHKRRWEGVEYAVEEYPVRYFEHSGLLNLDPEEACDHAASLADREAVLPPKECERLYDAALDADRACRRGEMGLS